MNREVQLVDDFDAAGVVPTSATLTDKQLAKRYIALGFTSGKERS